MTTKQFDDLSKKIITSHKGVMDDSLKLVSKILKVYPMVKTLVDHWTELNEKAKDNKDLTEISIWSDGGRFDQWTGKYNPKEGHKFSKASYYRYKRAFECSERLADNEEMTEEEINSKILAAYYGGSKRGSSSSTNKQFKYKINKAFEVTVKLPVGRCETVGDTDTMRIKNKYFLEFINHIVRTELTTKQIQDLAKNLSKATSYNETPKKVSEDNVKAATKAEVKKATFAGYSSGDPCLWNSKQWTVKEVTKKGLKLIATDGSYANDILASEVRPIEKKAADKAA